MLKYFLENYKAIIAYMIFVGAPIGITVDWVAGIKKTQAAVSDHTIELREVRSTSSEIKGQLKELIRSNLEIKESNAKMEQARMDEIRELKYIVKEARQLRQADKE